MLKEKKRKADGKEDGNAEEMSNQIDTGTEEGSQYVDSFTKKICVKLKVPCR